ncbi:MAG TPA: PIG-L family deacetylase [Bryobacteraceae bacterium]|nr:PIG-L family deacetylase [Bryobacteraceae bacterium]
MNLPAALKLFTVALALSSAVAQVHPPADAIGIPADRGPAAVWQSLKQLHTRASLIMITAHPDDEDGGALVWASRGLGARVALLTLNRGEGGANVMSSDFFDALGLVRTEELLAAGRYYGADQYFTRMIDYGFSKTLDESLGKWGHENVLREVVRVVRLTRPLVITSVFVGGPSDGHGNHQTAGLMAKEVFEAAADPNRFPEQIREGLRPWQAAKQYARVPFFGPEKESLAANVEVPEGTYDPLLGFTYAQLAREGLGYQKSQNGGTGIPPAGPRSSPYHRFASKIASSEKEKSFFDGIDTSLEGIASLGGGAAFLRDGLRAINADVEQAIARFDARRPEEIAGPLAEGAKKTARLIGEVESSLLSADQKYGILFELNEKKRQFNQALVRALGVSLRATVRPEQPVNPLMEMFQGEPDTFRAAIPGQTFRVHVDARAQSSSEVKLEKIEVSNTDGKPWVVESLPGSDFRVRVAPDAALTRPYFSRPDIEQPYYATEGKRYQNLPLAPYPLEAWADFAYRGISLRAGQVVQTVQHVNGYGEVLEPLTVAPAISIAVSPQAGIVPLGAKSFRVTAVIHSNVKGTAQGVVRLELPGGWSSTPASAPFTTARDGEDRNVQFQVSPAHLARREYRINAVARYAGKEYREGYRTTGYPGLRPYFLYSPSTYRTTGVDVKMAPGLKAAYVMGSGDEVPAALEHLGVQVAMLGPAELASGDLNRFDVIVAGVRAYAVREDLKTYNSRLLDYVKNGGVVIVQYNTPEFDHNYGPYPYSMTEDPEEVTDEDSKMEILAPENPVFQWPNAVTAADFAGWVEERGSKFMKSWDARYSALLSTHDLHQAPQKGGLLYARYGRGVWIYNAYAFYRQLPEGVPGAYRTFANLISLPKNPRR